jgi:hypothetical protein
MTAEMLESLFIKELARTCYACPSQWEGRLADDRPLYIRYRWGQLSVHIGPPGADIDTAVAADPWFDEAVGDEGLSGFIDLEEVLAVTGLVLAPAAT